MLKQILDSTGLSPHAAAGILGINEGIFSEWLAEQRPIPDSMVYRLSTVLGIKPSVLQAPRKLKGHAADLAPAIWYKLRAESLVDADRECVLLIRQLGYFVNQLEEVTHKKAVGWKALFDSIRRDTDNQAHPREQGRQAAAMFRESTSLGQGSTGIGEVIRGNLRSLGLLVIESPLPDSKFDGCCFYIGNTSPERPCIFANTHHNTWFRHNMVLMHEVGHAIFDAQIAGISVDIADRTLSTDLSETRAQAFAQEMLIPWEVLRHVSQAHSVRWDNMQPRNLAVLVAELQVEQREILKAALEHDLITSDQAERYLSFDIISDLRELTERALTAEEYIKKKGNDAAQWINKRATTIPSRSLRLPMNYVMAVLDAHKNRKISRSKAAELMMIDKDTFEERFGAMEVCDPHD